MGPGVRPGERAFSPRWGIEGASCPTRNVADFEDTGIAALIDQWAD